MIFGVTPDLIKIVSTWIRRADSGLVTNAARNAAHSMNAQQFRQLDDARTLRDLQSIPQPAAGSLDAARPTPAAHALRR